MRQTNRSRAGVSDLSEIAEAFNAVRDFGDGFVFNPADIMRSPRMYAFSGSRLPPVGGQGAAIWQR